MMLVLIKNKRNKLYYIFRILLYSILYGSTMIKFSGIYKEFKGPCSEYLDKVLL